MKRRHVLTGIGAASLVGLGVGSGVVSADDDVRPDACIICPDWECPGTGLCTHCIEDPDYC